MSAVWKMNGNPITSTERLLSVSPSEVSSGVYQSLLQFNPLGWLIDDGNYTCEVDVASETEHSTFVLATPTLSDTVSLLSLPQVTVCITVCSYLCKPVICDHDNEFDSQNLERYY